MKTLFLDAAAAGAAVGAAAGVAAAASAAYSAFTTAFAVVASEASLFTQRARFARTQRGSLRSHATGLASLA